MFDRMANPSDDDATVVVVLFALIPVIAIICILLAG